MLNLIQRWTEKEWKISDYQRLRKVWEKESLLLVFFGCFQFDSCSKFMIVCSFVDLIINFDFFSVLLIRSSFLIFVRKVNETEGGRFLVESSFYKCFWGEVRRLGHNWSCFMFIIQRKVCSWQLCVMQRSWRKNNFTLQFSYFIMSFFN